MSNKLEDAERELEQLEAMQRMYLRRYLHMLASDDPRMRENAIKTITEMNEFQKTLDEALWSNRPAIVDQINEMVDASRKVDDVDFWTTG